MNRLITLIYIALHFSILVFGQYVDITRTLTVKEGCVIKNNKDFFNWTYANVYVPDMVDNEVVTVLKAGFARCPIEEFKFPTHLKYLGGSFGFTKIKEVALPENLYFLAEKVFMELPNVEVFLSTPQKKDHEFIGWNGTLPGGAKAEQDRYIAHFKYLKEGPYTIAKEDVIFYDGILKLCYYYGSPDIVIPNIIDGKKVKYIRSDAFDNRGLKSVIIEDGIYNIGTYKKNNITNIVFPEGIKVIPNFAFSENNLTTIEIPSTVYKIGSSAFNKNQIQSIKFPMHLTYLSGFSRNNLSKIEFPTDVDTIGFFAFSRNKLESVLIPEKVTVIENGAFSHNLLKSIKIPSNVSYLGSLAFSNNEISSIELPSGLCFIGRNAFENNKFSKNNLPTLPQPKIEGKTFSHWEGTTKNRFGKVESVDSYKPGDVILDNVEYRAVFK
ncbi:MAG: leucine-rich repeat domain-containing protein [Bacteroidales bacterium]|nr:leucine-rich repeat domain-containing protein [Bacteroidales bacterium]